MMKARGYRFTTVTEGLNLARSRNSRRGKAAAAVPLLPVNPRGRRDGPTLARGARLLWTVRIADGAGLGDWPGCSWWSGC